LSRGIIITACLLLIVLAAYKVRNSPYLKDASNTPPPFNFGGTKVCDDAWTTDKHFENVTSDNVVVDLKEGCFSGYVHLPTRWGRWYSQPVGDGTDNYWIAFWFPNDSPLGPYRTNDTANFGIRDPVFRVEGHGKVRFYTAIPPPSR
jgi:hypothetical protein